jgi:hypothetical protein
MNPIRVRRVASARSRRSPRRAFHVAAVTAESGAGCMRAIRMCRNRVRLSRKSPKIDRSRSGGRDHRNIGRSEGAVPSAGRFHPPAHGGLPRPIDAPEPGSIFATASRDCGGSNASRRAGATPKRDANVICQLAAANHRQARRTKSRGQTPEQRLSQLSLSAWKLELAGVHLLGTKRGSPDPRVKRATAAHL